MTPPAHAEPRKPERLRLVPVTLAECKAFVAKHHRHNKPPVGWRFGVGVATGTLRGVAVASRPVARRLDDGRTLEVVRTCTDGARNANSMLYGAIARAAKALGYERVVTYTLAEEPGTSLKAAGWERDAEVPAEKSWSNSVRARVQTDLYGSDQRPAGPKVRWIKRL